MARRSSVRAKTTRPRSSTARASPTPASAGTTPSACWPRSTRRCERAGVDRTATLVVGAALQPLAAPVDVVAAEAVEVGAVEHARQHEQQVAQPVEVLARRRVDQLGLTERNQCALR